MAQVIVNSQAQTERFLNGIGTNDSPDTVVTDLLIIGTGPAGASLASFLTSHGKQTRLSKVQVLIIFSLEGNYAWKRTR